jgi:hypothetical protein
MTDKAFGKNLGAADPENLRGRSPGVPVAPGGNAGDCFHRRVRNDPQDPHPSWAVADPIRHRPVARAPADLILL